MSTTYTTRRLLKIIFTLTVMGVLALTVRSLSTSSASFTTGAAQPDNVVVAGSVTHSNDHDGLLLIDAAGLVPGTGRSGTMTLGHAGTASGRFHLSVAGLVDSATVPGLSEVLVLTVEDVLGARVLYRGPVSAFTHVDLGAVTPGSARPFKLTVEYPPGPNQAALQGATLQLGLAVTGSAS
jgi:hypothetical protein